MNSRERFKKTILIKEPDKVPIDFGQDHHNSIHEKAYINLINYLGIKDDIRIYDYTQRLAKVKDEVLKRFQVDTRYIFANPNEKFKLKIEEDGSYTDEFGVKRKRCSYYCENVYSPMAEFSKSEIIKWKLPDPNEPSRFKCLKEKAKLLYDNTDYALIAGDPGSLFYLATELRGYQKFMEELAMDQNLIEVLIEKVLDWNISFMTNYLKEIGDYIEMVWFGDDWGTQLGPIMSPSIFRKIFKSRYIELVNIIKKFTKAKLCLHSCGSVLWAIQDFIDIGIEVLHPLQSDAKSMNNPELIKKMFGKKITFYSNMPNQTVIPYGSPSEVRNEVIKRLKYLAPGGGYIFSMGHNLQADVPPENIVVAFDTLNEFGYYPIEN